MNQISIFKNFTTVSASKTLEEIIQIIRGDHFRDTVIDLRNLLADGSKEAYSQRKKSLPAFTPCGVFSGGRKQDKLVSYSRMVILDIDKVDDEQLHLIRNKALKDPYTHCCFLSPSGAGLKILVKVASGLPLHRVAFEQVKVRYEKLLKVEIDPTGKDVTRLCFFSWDPDLYFNPESNIFLVEHDISTKNDVEKLVEKIEESHTDITSNYEEWCNIGFALESEFGETGRAWFLALSRFNPEYNAENCNLQYEKCLRNNNSGITIKTLFHIAKQHGITVHGPGVKKQTEKQEAEKDERKVSTNRFILAKEYLEQNYEIRNNIVSNEFEFRTKDEKVFKPLNENTIFIRMQLDGVNLSLNNLVALLKSEMVADYNPFQNYFSSLPDWDQTTDHIVHLAGFIKVNEQDRNRFNNHFKKWLVRAVKCALVDSYFNKQAFILVHDKQNSGKSTFCRFLCPKQLNNYIAENLSIDKDSRILLTTNMLINLDELSTLSKVEINALKSLFSKDKINDRLPYDRKNSIIPRRASFIGSTNQMEFLNDESGSVRWLCFVIEEIDWSYIDDVNIDLVYSQAYHLYKVGYSADLIPEEIRENEKVNKRFQITTPEREMIQKYLLPGDENDYERFMTATEVLVHVKEVGALLVTLHPVNVGKALKFLGYERIKHPKHQVYGYYVKYNYENIENPALR